jgi:low affinity Fe/Cu permease
MNLATLFDRFSRKVTKITGSYWAFIIACLIVIVWGATGPLFHYSENWQLIINTGTTIITFLMVFIIQQSNNKDTKAIQLKLDELIRSIENAKNDLISIEEKTDEEIDQIKGSNKV